MEQEGYKHKRAECSAECSHHHLDYLFCARPEQCFQEVIKMTYYNESVLGGNIQKMLAPLRTIILMLCNLRTSVWQR